LASQSTDSGVTQPKTSSRPDISSTPTGSVTASSAEFTSVDSDLNAFRTRVDSHFQTLSSAESTGSFTSIPWSTIFPLRAFSHRLRVELDPNPHPASTATAETFVEAGSTRVVSIPTATTTVTLSNATFVLGPGGTPEIGPFPLSVILLSATTPTWGKLFHSPSRRYLHSH
jgi:hypothetical protein